jgi:hypothetical protein
MNDKLNLIADEIIGYSDGSYRLDYPEEYNALTFEEQGKVDEMVYEQIGECDHCGWHFNYDNLEMVDGHGELCGSCVAGVADEDESDED